MVDSGGMRVARTAAAVMTWVSTRWAAGSTAAAAAEPLTGISSGPSGGFSADATVSRAPASPCGANMAPSGSIQVTTSFVFQAMTGCRSRTAIETPEGSQTLIETADSSGKASLSLVFTVVGSTVTIDL